MPDVHLTTSAPGCGGTLVVLTPEQARGLAGVLMAYAAEEKAEMVVLTVPMGSVTVGSPHPGLIR